MKTKPKSILKSVISLTLALIMVLGVAPLSQLAGVDWAGLFAPEAEALQITSYKTGDIIEFGRYPQSKVTDSSLISALTAAAGDNKSWTSYGYYSGTGSDYDGQMTASDYMRYKDVVYGSNKYRGVIFDSYRPCRTGYTSSASDSYQDDNGYSTGTVYWFKYEPIEWRVLDPSTGMVMSETILDSQAYNNYMLSFGPAEDDIDTYWGTYRGTYWGDASKTYYANNYAKSSLRKWLNEDFYNTAFSAEQKNSISTTHLDNSAYSYSAYDYNSEDTYDKIYLLSYNDVINSSYGFSSDPFDYDTARMAQGSDYAKCQGLYVELHAYSGNSHWRLRSAGNYSFGISEVISNGDAGQYYYAGHTHTGVRPALNFNLKSEISQASIQSSKPEQLPLLVSIYGDSTLSVKNGQSSPNPFEVSVHIKNTNTSTVKNAWVEISFSSDNLTTNGMSKVKLSLGDLSVGQEIEQKCTVTAKNLTPNTNEVIKITAGGDGIEAKTSEKYITVSNADKNNEIKWGEKKSNDTWSGEDNLGFINSRDCFFKKRNWSLNFNKIGTYKNCYMQLDDAYFFSLIAGMEPTVVEYIGKKRNNPSQPWSGSCYGMSAVVSLMKDGQLTPSYWQKGAKTAHDLKMPKKSKTVMNLVNFYQLSQCLPDQIEQKQSYEQMSQSEIMKQIVTDCQKVQNGGLPVIITFWWLKNGYTNGEHKSAGHAVLGYHVDRVDNDKTGSNSYRVSICDPNYSEWKYMYISSDFSSWSYEGLKTTVNDPNSVWIKDGVEQKSLSAVRASLNQIDPKNPESGVNRTVLKNYSSNFISSFTASGCAVLDSKGEKIDGESIPIPDGDSITFLPDDTQFTVVPNESKSIDTSLVLKDCSATVVADNVEKLIVKATGEVAFCGDSSECDLSLTLNSSLSTLPWYTVNLKGSEICDYLIKPTAGGVIVSGSDLSKTTITANNLEQTVSVDISTDAESILLTDEGNDKIGVYADLDGDGTYENKIAEGGIKHETSSKGVVITCIAAAGATVLAAAILVIRKIRKKKKDK